MLYVYRTRSFGGGLEHGGHFGDFYREFFHVDRAESEGGLPRSPVYHAINWFWSVYLSFFCTIVSFVALYRSVHIIYSIATRVVHGYLLEL